MKGIVLVLSAIAAVSTAVQCPRDAPESALLLQHNDCNKFYKCISGQAFEQACSNGLLFNVETSQCDVAQNVQCGVREVPEIDSQDVNEDEISTGNRWWWWWRPTTTTRRPIVTPPPTTPEPEEPALETLPNGCPKDPNTHWLLPNENDCNLFYSCVWGQKVLQSCPSELNFHVTLQVCDWPWRARCAISVNKDASARRRIIENSK